MNIGLLILRLVVGLLFAGHGCQKLFGWFGGHGIAATTSGFQAMGLRPAKLHAITAGLFELGGGLLLALGLLTPLAALLIIAVMTTAIVVVHLRNGLWATGGGYEYNLVLAASAFALAGAGAGRYSLDHALSLHVAGWKWAVGALVLGVLGGYATALSRRLGSAGPSREDTGAGAAA